MKVQAPFIQITLLLIGICLYVQARPAYEKTNFIFELSNNTIKLNIQTNTSFCISNDDCPRNSWCNKNKCQCMKGWLTWYNYRQCSYKQVSKMSSFLTSFLIGGTGLDWFILSRKNSLYILTGLLKLLISIAGYIWTGFAVINKTESSMIVASCFSFNLCLMAIIWWIVDWIRILLNKFPDGNGAPLI
jgi:hypothetical protein